MVYSLYENRGIGNHGSCIHQNKYPVQDDRQSFHDSLQAYLLEWIGHCFTKQSNDCEYF